MSENKRKLEVLNDNLLKCEKCTLIKEGECPVQPMMGKNLHYIFLGYIPSAEDKLYGEIFSDLTQKGKNLRRLIALAGISLQDCYFTNVMKCHTKIKIKPTDVTRAYECYFHWLYRELELVKSRIIFTLGKKSKEFCDLYIKDRYMVELPDINMMLMMGDGETIKMMEDGINGYKQQLPSSVRL